jgi:flagellar hook protein FlgE
MNANGTALSVVSDNIANVNTVGYKYGRVTFGDVLSQTLTSGTNNSQIGRGVLMSDISPVFVQGSFESTANALDMAIDGDGFFMVNDSSGSFYTRAGQFTLDKDGFIVSPDGLKLQGYQYTSAGAPTGVIGDIELSALSSSTEATSEVVISANIDSREPVTTIIDPTDEAEIMSKAQFSSAVTVYDSLGNKRVVTLHFVKTGANMWDWYGVVDPADLAVGEDPVQARGSMAFDTSGALTSVTSATGSTVGNTANEVFNFGGGSAAGQTIDFDFDTFSQYASSSATIFQSQNGFPSGMLKSLSVSQEGVVSGIFTNGQIKPVAQVALVKFMAPTQLTKMGRNLYSESFDSGHAIVGTANEAGLGRVMSNALELSTVDLAREFVNMISAQRGFQANSRVITTTDTLLQELVSLTR